MKKIIMLAAFLGGVSTMQAQSVEGTKLLDNWSVGINAGMQTRLKGDKLFSPAREMVGVEVSKQLTPVFGLGIEGMWGINTTGAYTAFDHSNVSLLGKINFMNLFAGYKGVPRLFELEGVLGTGWLHTYGDVSNAWSTKAGLNINFNLGEKKAWTVALKPAVVWNMDGDAAEVGYSRFNAHSATFELTAGLVYHLGSSNNAHHFTFVKPYNQTEVDNLNTRINKLRSSLDEANANITKANGIIVNLNKELTDCRNKKPAVERVVSTKDILESVITFAQGKSVVAASQLPNVERVATYMKNHTKAKVSIKGYASPEGSVEINNKIAAARAEAVKTILVNKYGIAAGRISAESQGVGNMFSEPDWNRVSICTLEDSGAK